MNRCPTYSFGQYQKVAVWSPSVSHTGKWSVQINTPSHYVQVASFNNERDAISCAERLAR